MSLTIPDVTHYAYRVTWSSEAAEFVGTCVEFTSPSWLADTQDEALHGRFLRWAGLHCRPGSENQKCDRRGRRSVLAVPKTPTVSLRPRTEDDLDLLFEIAADLDTWEERNPQAPRPLTRGQFDSRLGRSADDSGPEAAVSLVIDVDGTAAGAVTLFDFDLLARHAEAGINLKRNARGRGIGTAAVVQLVEFGFVRHNLRRIHLQAISSNLAAIRAYEKAGFVIEGRQRQHAWVRGRYEDIVLMGILRSDQTSSD